MERDEALRQAVTAGLDILQANTPDAELAGADSANVIRTAWPYIESFKDTEGLHEFVDRFGTRFPDHELQPFGGSVFDYVVGNIRNAVIAEIISRLEEEHQLIKGASKQTAFKRIPSRDWKIVQARISDDISIIRQMAD